MDKKMDAIEIEVKTNHRAIIIESQETNCEVKEGLTRFGERITTVEQKLTAIEPKIIAIDGKL